MTFGRTDRLGDYADLERKLTQGNGARAKRGRRSNSFGTRGSVQDVVGRSLRLCGSMNQKLAIVAQLLHPAGDIAGLIVNDFV